MLLRGDEGLAPLDQEAQNSKSTHLLHQSRDGRHRVASGKGRGPMEGLLMTALEGALSYCPSGGGGGGGELPESSE